MRICEDIQKMFKIKVMKNKMTEKITKIKADLEHLSDTESTAEASRVQETDYPLTKQYKSAEKRIFVDSGIRNFLVYGGKALYGTIISMFRIPTLIRKGYNDQTLLDKDKEIKRAAAQRYYQNPENKKKKSQTMLDWWKQRRRNIKTNSTV